MSNETTFLYLKIKKYHESIKQMKYIIKLNDYYCASKRLKPATDVLASNKWFDGIICLDHPIALYDANKSKLHYLNKNRFRKIVYSMPWWRKLLNKITGKN